MLHHSFHKLHEADLLREAERERTVRAALRETDRPAGSPRRFPLPTRLRLRLRTARP